MTLSAAQLDRAAGTLLASACGDALGAGYEFGTAPLPPEGTAPRMIGGGLGGFAPGEWTDDTAQAYAIAEVAATGADLRTPAALDAIAQGFADWFAPGPSDVGIQTAQVLRAAGRTPSAATMRAAADEVHCRTGRSAGNGSLMRTAPVALAHLDDPAALVEAAYAVSALTHHDPLAGEAAAVWCLFLRHAILTGSLDAVRDELRHLPAEVRGRWSAWLDEAEQKQPATFHINGWAVGALQAAWSAVVHTPVPDEAPADLRFACEHLQHGLETAIRIGNDTDTVAAIAGALLGARWGACAVPWQWRRILHGWPGTTAEGDPVDARRLVELATLTVLGGPDSIGWPLARSVLYPDGPSAAATEHPFVSGVLLGTHATRDHDASAVVAACRVGRTQSNQVRRDGSRVEVVVESRLIDADAVEANPHLHFVLYDAADAVRTLRAEGHTVLLHCVAGEQRTPSIAVALARLEGIDAEEARAALARALHSTRGSGRLWQAPANWALHGRPGRMGQTDDGPSPAPPPGDGRIEQEGHDVSTQANVLDDLEWRGLIAHSTDRDALHSHLGSGAVRYYVGFDPTAPSLHIGNLVQILTARRLQDAGHTPYLLVGGATGLIGDPRDSGERVLNTLDTVKEWVDKVRAQLEPYLSFEGPNAATMVNNYDWTAPLSTIDFLRDVGKHFPVNRMLARDTVKRRLESGISFTEFSYVLLQSMDYLNLYRDHGVTLQFGGSDQWGNLTGGVELVRRSDGGHAHAFATPLITKSDGTKYGKSEGGALWLDPEMLSPYAFYQFWLNVEDVKVGELLRAFTFIGRTEIERIEAEHAEKPYLRLGQKTLARAVTTIVHGAEETDRIEAAAAALFGGGDLTGLAGATLSAALGEAGAVRLDAATSRDIVDLLVESGLAKSRGEARRTIGEGGAYLNNQRITDPEFVPAADDILDGGWLVLRRGKKNMAGVQLF